MLSRNENDPLNNAVDLQLVNCSWQHDVAKTVWLFSKIGNKENVPSKHPVSIENWSIQKIMSREFMWPFEKQCL